jgi:1-acyl-sn-glycerol-3-phosphate acyltransferase
MLFSFSKAMLLAGGRLFFRISYEGGENIPRQGALIVASNHQSHLDPPLVGVGVPRHVFFMAKREFTKFRLFRWFLGDIGTIFVNRSQGREALNAAMEFLQAGRAIVIFPEGTRTRTGHIGTGKKGVAILAHRTGATVVPACIVGADKCFPAGSRRIRLGRIKVYYGEPLRFELIPEGQIPEDLLAETTTIIMNAIIALAPPEIRPLAQNPSVKESREIS